MKNNNLVLIAEDEIADIVIQYLHRAHMQTLRVANGEQALMLNRLYKPELILL
ncbi:hypothetical protein [Atlantibacter sp.]|uniref:hypothetical protein n=1 Tax=Atlantibacter sp. TaxID=1903473 RepID=UPI0028A0D65D|nr:hypothetical protein [Atlantibacter sp.]